MRLATRASTGTRGVKVVNCVRVVKGEWAPDLRWSLRTIFWHAIARRRHAMPHILPEEMVSRSSYPTCTGQSQRTVDGLTEGTIHAHHDGNCNRPCDDQWRIRRQHVRPGLSRDRRDQEWQLRRRLQRQLVLVQAYEEEREEGQEVIAAPFLP